MTLKLYNTLTRSKDEFKPLKDGEVKMYVCGPTVYSRPHIGNARSVVVYDVLYRLLKHLYPNVTYVRNITDVDDKINAAAIERGISIQALTSEVTQWFHDDMDALGCLRPTHEPRATEHIQEMITIIEALIKNGNAYVADGHVLFDVKSDADYGKLSGRVQEDLEAGSRVKVESYKKNASDFVLWKPTDDKDDPSSVFDSPWGKGRPGWHIECSAMSSKYLGNDFDIHGGGADLMFPHHENEIAQSCCAHPGTGYAKVWVHNGFLTVNSEKMSKSLGNFITVRDLLDKKAENHLARFKKWAEVIRWALLSTHYRNPLDWTEKLLEDSKKSLDYIYRSLKNYDLQATKLLLGQDQYRGIYDQANNLFSLLYAEDLNIPHIQAELVGLSNSINSYVHTGQKDLANVYGHVLFEQCKLMGFMSLSTDEWLKETIFAPMSANLSGGGNATAHITGVSAMAYVGNVSARADSIANIKGVSASVEVGGFNQKASSLDAAALVQSLISARTAAKNSKNWKEADRIRDELKSQGIILEDKPDGTTDWRRA